jgi:cell division protein FtsL
MALPALKREYVSDSAVVPRLRLVKRARPVSARASRSTSSRSKAAEMARCRRGFHLTCAALVFLSAMAMVRVELTVRATEASLTANALRKDIESERVRGESLEARRTALATPARIESIAGVSMRMGSADSVAYIEMPTAVDGDDTGTRYAEAGSEVSVSSQRVAGLLASIMRMTAGEAQVLLVGDAGLASSR